MSRGSPAPATGTGDADAKMVTEEMQWLASYGLEDLQKPTACNNSGDDAGEVHFKWCSSWSKIQILCS